MNKIIFELLPGYEPSLMIKIDGIDVFSMEEFKGTFIPTDVLSFLFNEYMWTDSEENTVFNGIMLIGTCTCGCQGCDDLLVKITTTENITTWEIYPDRDENIKKTFVFKSDEYGNEIEQLKNNYYGYSWEDKKHKINRLCTEYIRTFKTKNGKNIEGVNIENVVENNKYTEKLKDVMELYFYDDWEPCGEGYVTPRRTWEIKWDGKTIENALNNLKIFAEKEFIKNNDEVNLRPSPFRLLYTKDKNIIENKL